MGHRALVAYERPDSLYNLHYSHWGASDLRLKHAITPETPFGEASSTDGTVALFEALTEAYDEEGASHHVGEGSLGTAQVDRDPLAVAVTREEICNHYLDYLHHEAFYEVPTDFDVAAYRTFWFGLEYDCETIDQSSTVGNGALATVRWFDGHPVGDGFIRGEFRALKDVVGDMIDRGVFTPAIATEYMQAKLADWLTEEQDLLVYTPGASETVPETDHYL
ncbi:hypothetical protein BV210_05040 [Halorientalis sp. IM1011]|uniref:DUF6735 family protein n=1 Tax=Halorientalis sp. IM1011 TaxID=1932360 RepID=UPI00097CD032|nr:DUF6735 family protein [Halorientalis sp. IM1011]AQL42116.1 hypothetical protein BV210_05040 [Halorientalis sp. IM1011]